MQILLGTMVGLRMDRDALRSGLHATIVDVFLKSRESKDEGEQEEDDEQEEDAGKPGYVEELTELGVAAPWAVLGGVVGIVSGVPAGGIVGALVASAAFELVTGRSVPLARFRIGVQVLGGVVIGLGVSSSLLGELGRLALAGAVIIPVQMLFWLMASWLLVRFSGYDLSTSALASTPGGISGVIPAAEETDADAVIVTFMHLVRLSTVVVVVPILVTVFFGR